MKKISKPPIGKKIMSIYDQVVWYGLLIVMSFKVPGDPDLGWHLQNGWYTITHYFIPQQGDVYSWTMPNYPWVSHEWLTEVVMTGINQLTGLWGIAIFFALLVAFVFWLAAGIGQTKKEYVSLFALVGILVSWPIIGARPQMLTLLGLAIILRLLFVWRENRKNIWLWYLPLTFLLWANLHAGFLAGFLVIGVFTVAEGMRALLVREPRKANAPTLRGQDLWRLIYFSGFGLLLTLINPYGWRIYQELWQTLGQTNILNSIAEWLPVDLASKGSINLLLMIGLLVGLLIWNKFKVDYTKLMLALVFLIVALGSWRHLPLFAIVSLPLLAEQMTPVLKHSFDQVFRHLPVRIIIACLLILGLWWNVFRDSADMISNPKIYASANKLPYGAIEYIKTHSPLPQKMFNEYNWGGYLIWKMPEAKVFIDGRMAIWRDGKTAIFDEFQNFTGNRSSIINETLDRWGIDLVLVYPNRGINTVLESKPDLWKKVYADNDSVVWRRVS